MKGLQSHLKECRDVLDLNDLLWVVGNQSVDLDSVVCTLVYSYFMKGIPVINCTNEEFDTKTEVVFLLKTFGIDKKSLIFVDNLRQVSGRVILVDHHNISPGLVGLGEIWQIIDHHMTKKELLAKNLVKLEKVGSCATLVFEEVEKKNKIEDLELLKMIAAPILLDTFNLDLVAKKVTQSDMKVIETIRERSEFSRTEWFQELQHAKQDISSLTPKQLLNKDCKRWTDYVISSVPISLSELLDFAGDEIAPFFKESGTRLYIIMTLFQELEFEREILIVTDDDWQLEEELVQLFQKSGFDLIPFDLKQGYSGYKQKNIIFSRKEVVPLLEQNFRGV